MKWLRYDSEKSYCSNHVIWLLLVRFWGFDCGCNICLDQHKWKVEEGRKWASVALLTFDYFHTLTFLGFRIREGTPEKNTPPLAKFGGGGRYGELNFDTFLKVK